MQLTQCVYIDRRSVICYKLTTNRRSRAAERKGAFETVERNRNHVDDPRVLEAGHIPRRFNFDTQFMPEEENLEDYGLADFFVQLQMRHHWLSDKHLAATKTVPIPWKAIIAAYKAYLDDHFWDSSPENFRDQLEITYSTMNWNIPDDILEEYKRKSREQEKEQGKKRVREDSVDDEGQPADKRNKRQQQIEDWEGSE